LLSFLFNPYFVSFLLIFFLDIEILLLLSDLYIFERLGVIFFDSFLSFILDIDLVGDVILSLFYFIFRFKLKFLLEFCLDKYGDKFDILFTYLFLSI